MGLLIAFRGFWNRMGLIICIAPRTRLRICWWTRRMQTRLELFFLVKQYPTILRAIFRGTLPSLPYPPFLKHQNHEKNDETKRDAHDLK